MSRPTRSTRESLSRSTRETLSRLSLSLSIKFTHYCINSFFKSLFLLFIFFSSSIWISTEPLKNFFSSLSNFLFIIFSDFVFDLWIFNSLIDLISILFKTISSFNSLSYFLISSFELFSFFYHFFNIFF